ncbi:MAG: hypothetical protein JF609_07355 [Verrucomicrobia bacterium]|nr:hypothetical protein [Verrucomicrobiota bacterium]
MRTMHAANPFKSYRQVATQTAPPGQLVLMLFDGALIATVPRRERQINLSELRPGMVLASDIYTPNGLLLVPEGKTLNATCIEKVLNYNRFQPLVQALTVYC